MFWTVSGIKNEVLDARQLLLQGERQMINKEIILYRIILYYNAIHYSLKALSCTSTHVQTHCSRVLASGRGRDPEEHRLLRTLDAVTRVCTHIPLFLNGTSSCTTGHGTFTSRQIFAPRLVQVMPITGPEALLQTGTFLGPVPASTCLVLPGITSRGHPAIHAPPSEAQS